MEYFWPVVWLASVVWVGADAARLGIRRGQLGGGMLDMGVVSWVLAVLLIWIIGFPCYLVARSQHVQLRQQQRWAAQPQPGYHQPGYPHPGYPHPGSTHQQLPGTFPAQAPDPRFGTPPVQPGAQTVLPSVPDGGR
ncbi:hypothetical protein GCM10028777_36310 [Angustibacter speluncae]